MILTGQYTHDKQQEVDESSRLLYKETLVVITHGRELREYLNRILNESRLITDSFNCLPRIRIY